MLRESKVMTYWLLSTVPHSSEFPNWMRTQVAMIDSIPVDSRLKDGDVVYLYSPEHDAIFGWGYAQRRTPAGSEQADIMVAGGKIQNFLTEPGKLRLNRILVGLLEEFVGATAFLLNTQIKELDRMMAYSGPKPPLPNKKQFVLNEVVEDDEGLEIEYKNVVVNQISKEAYEYALAYIRGGGGSIFFGVRDDKLVVGVEVDYENRDRIVGELENKLAGIQPRLKANQDYHTEFHKVVDERGNPISDRYIFEVEVRARNDSSYKSASGKEFEKTYSGRKRIAT